MIRVVNGAERSRYPAEMDQMFRARAEIFGNRMGWDITLRDGWEIDAYDDVNPLYLLSIDSMTGSVRGSLRLLPTAGPHMMRDVFRQYFEAPVLIESPLVWECTRFCIHPGHEGSMLPGGVHLATSELLLGICEVALSAGVDQITGVFDRRMVRIYRRVGWNPVVIGRSETAGAEPIMVGLWDATDRALATMRARSGIGESVLETAVSDPLFAHVA